MRQNPKNKSALAPALCVATMVTAGVGVYMLSDQQLTQIADQALQMKEKANDLAVANGLSTCRIKGNISINSGAKIYHVPGQKYYFETVIRPRYGERWFCTEADARKAGWRKARR